MARPIRMSLTFEERVSIVERLTASAAASPRRYHTRVLAWIGLGYAIIATLLAIALLLTAGVVALILSSQAWGLVVFLWIPVAFGFSLARALFVRMDAPQGRALRRHEAPRLFAILDEIRARVQVPRLDVVLITTDMNAAVVEMPRFGGLFGWRRHLMIGLPMLIAMSPEEMKAILAHELGHLSAQHGRVAAWSWRVRLTWGTAVASMDARRGVTARVLQRIMHWYLEHLMLITLVLARRHELAADVASAKLTDRKTAARALAWSAVATQLLERRYWAPLWERVAVDPQPPANPLHDLLRRRAELFGEPHDDVLATELARKTAIDDTHPALRARLQHLGHTQPVIGLDPQCAADAFLGRTAAAVIAESDRIWRSFIRQQWQEQHRALAGAREQAATELDLTAETNSLHERAEALVQLARDAEALPIYEALLARDAKDARAAFHVGRILVQRGDLSGVTQLSNAMQLDWRVGSAACELVYAALRDKGYEKDAFAWAERYEQQQAAIEAAQIEAATLSPQDDITATTLSEELQTRILELCVRAKWVGSVWIARKNLKAVPDGVNIVALRGKMFRFSSHDRFQRLVNEFPPEAQVMVFLVDSGTLMRRLTRAGARRTLRK
ncbi:MAG TPA: M48 family metallopeptidase [Thermoanaerobaculia bacterium]|nr:M48 family metallopeptidase [Thermoanaerobaculia bacterium]